MHAINTLRPGSLAKKYVIFQILFLNKNSKIFNKISQNFVPKDFLISDKWSLVQVMPWYWAETKQLPEPMLIHLVDVCMHHYASVIAQVNTLIRKPESCHDANFVITGGTRGCHDIVSCQRQKWWQWKDILRYNNVQYNHILMGEQWVSNISSIL